jgi:uncharacterized membrane protein
VAEAERGYHPGMDDPQAEDLKRNVDELRGRVERLERLAYPSPPPAAAARPYPPPPPPKPIAPRFQENLRESPPRDEAGGASWLLGVVAVICFVLAASFLVKLAIDSGWLTPARQLAMAAIFGGTLIATGVVFAERDIAYLSLLPGTGVVVLYMCAYGGHLYYPLYDGKTAAGLATVVSIVSLVLYRGFAQEYYAMVAIAGTYLTPLLVPVLRGDRFDLMLYYVIWDAAYVVLSLLLGSRFVLLMAAYLSIATFAAVNPATGVVAGTADPGAIALFQALQFAIFLAGIVLYSTSRKAALTAGQAWAYFPLLLFFYLLEYALVNQVSPDTAPWLAIGFGLAIYAAYAVSVAFLGNVDLESREVVLAFLAIVFVHAVYFELVPGRATPWFALALFVATPALNALIKPRTSSPFLFLAVVVVVAINYVKVLVGFGEGFTSGEWILLNLMFAGAALWTYLAATARGLDSASWSLVLVLGDIQAMTGLYRIASEVTGPGWSPTSSRFVVSAFWGMLALGILVWGGATRDKLLARSSLFVFGVATAKVLLFDVATAGPVVRILCLVTLGVALYVGGYLFRRIDRWGDS